ncbi:MAG: hypothetical protein BDTLLHRC_000650 [Candidatus Fervidibacter sp.]
MCFQNLPIEFDEQGRPRLKSGVRDPYAYRRVSFISGSPWRSKRRSCGN